MALHRLSPAAGTVHGIFSRERAPVLTIASGDSVVFQTLDAGWGALEQAPGFTVPQAFAPRDLARDVEGLADLRLPSRPQRGMDDRRPRDGAADGGALSPETQGSAVAGRAGRASQHAAAVDPVDAYIRQERGSDGPALPLRHRP
jgi:hypothetical protein